MIVNFDKRWDYELKVNEAEDIHRMRMFNQQSPDGLSRFPLDEEDSCPDVSVCSHYGDGTSSISGLAISHWPVSFNISTSFETYGWGNRISLSRMASPSRQWREVRQGEGRRLDEPGEGGREGGTKLKQAWFVTLTHPTRV